MKYNDPYCGWNLGFDSHLDKPVFSGKAKVDWLVIGSGYTGVAAARRITELHPDARVMLIDAEQMGEGASARNSGFIVDSTLNDGASTSADVALSRTKYDLNSAGKAVLKQQVDKHGIECDWHEGGKMHCAVSPKLFKKLDQFEQLLTRMELPYQRLDAAALREKMGTTYYQSAVLTPGSVLVNPSQLIKGLLSALPNRVECFEGTRVTHIEPKANSCLIHTQSELGAGEIVAQQTIVAVNALMPKLGIKRNHVFPLTLTGSLTRRLLDEEFEQLGAPDAYGALSVHPMGCTLRLTNDRRILMRNTAELVPHLKFSNAALKKRTRQHRDAFLNRFPGLHAVPFESTWAGHVCMSSNSKPVFERCAGNVWVSGCYNAGGIAMGSLFGELLVEWASGLGSEQLTKVQSLQKACVLPPQPFRQIGLKATLAYKRWHGLTEQ